MATPKIKYSSQEIDNMSFDETYRTPIIQQKETPMAMKVTTVGTVSYIAVAPVGTAQSAAAWQVKKVDTTTGTVVTWADGDGNFDNVATDLTALSYS